MTDAVVFAKQEIYDPWEDEYYNLTVVDIPATFKNDPVGYAKYADALHRIDAGYSYVISRRKK